MRDNNILKAVLLLRKVGNRYTTKEEQVAEVQGWFDKGYMTDSSLQDWIESLKEELVKTPEQLEAESEELLERLCEAEAEQARQEMESFSCCSARDYGPSNPCLYQQRVTKRGLSLLIIRGLTSLSLVYPEVKPENDFLIP